MIALATNCLLFELAGGVSVPFSSDMLSVELEGEAQQWFDAEFVTQAAKAVFHYFRQELGRQTVTVGEFAGALQKVLSGFKRSGHPAERTEAGKAVLESDLGLLAHESGEGCELFFFPRLRDELRQQLQRSPRAVRFHGLRGCVKKLAGTQRWTVRCRSLEEQIVGFLRECLRAEPEQGGFSMVVE